MPDCMLSALVLPITRRGFESSILGSLAAFSKSASRDVRIPGQMMPPRYSPLDEIASRIVAVPKSMITRGAPYLFTAATACAMRSGPTSFGFSYLMLMPVLMPGPTIRGSTPKYLKTVFSKTGVSGGTTEASTAP